VIIDVLIVLVVLATAWVGFQRGLVQPLMAELFALGTGLVILHNRSGFAAATQAFFHANGVLTVLIGLVIAGLMGYLGARLGGAIHKMPVVRGVDGFLGVWLQALFGVGLLYVLISGIVVMDRAFAPLTATSINAAQLQSVERQLGANPFTSGLVDGDQLRSFEARAARPGGVKVADLPGLSGLQALQRDFLRPQLTGSRLAPFVMNVGRHIPGLGPFGPGDLPGRK
jgi:hypothetical protein